ncbi:ABC-type uncharacterized transport system fused permease/ATPase subunit [Agrobacterium pusense]|nr:ABC-type uncharacterized transport system fused permease/ATPase subunit [Agrobacterium pusense]
MTDADANSKRADGTGKNGAGKVHVENAADEPLPPEEIEPAEGLTPEEAEKARKKYLLKRFWISARGFWSRRGDGLAWPFSIGLLVMIGINVAFQYGVNVWNRGIFDAIEKRDASTVYFLASIFPPLVLGSVLIRSSGAGAPG